MNATLRREKEKWEKQQQLKEDVGTTVGLSSVGSFDGAAYPDGDLRHQEQDCPWTERENPRTEKEAEGAGYGRSESSLADWRLQDICQPSELPVVCNDDNVIV